MGKIYAVRWLRVIWGRVIRKMAQRGASPHSIALGTSIGVFISMTPTIGLQMMIGVCIATLVKANRVAAALPAWITNPATLIPIYSFNYWIGWFLTGKGPGVDAFIERFSEVIKTVETEGALEAFRTLLALGIDILLPLWVGCILVGVVLAIPSYPLMIRAVTLFHQMKANKRKIRHQRFMALLQKREEDRRLLIPEYEERNARSQKI